MNHCGQVAAWQLTRSTSIDECESLLISIKERIQSQQDTENEQIEVYVDNCCSIRGKLQR